MVQVETLGAFFLASLVLGLAPGPDNIFVLTQSALYGARAGLLTTLGLLTGLCCHTLVVALGLAALLQNSPVAFTVLKIAGAIYLLYLARGAFRSGAAHANVQRAVFPGYGPLYLRGVLMNLTNPKVSLFCLAFLPQFADPARGDLALQIVVLGCVLVVSTLLVFSAVALLGGTLLSRFNNSPGGQILLNRIAGCIFAGLALLLVFSTAG